MGYTLRAFVGRPPALKPLTEASPHAHLIPLQQGFGLIPLTDELFDALNNSSQGEELAPFYFFTTFLETQVVALIGTQMVGYIEAEYFGGDGE
ncbi:hypothetical protein GCM10022409_19060 [Hymenobacter glaciei]|uniref:Uncharacterized protein n=1 Tax=Hymenobacter glaciei TaxID=877209 RepID=A0ABP7U4G1_9BACT